MAHQQQIDFCLKVRTQFPEYFKNKICLDVGSLDINGSNRYLFENCSYTGIDVGEGKNVDIVCLGHEFSAPDESYDTIISTECFEHDMHYKKTIKNIYRMLKPNGLFLFSCATTGRAEHGTARCIPEYCPLTHQYPDWANYYKNLTEEHINEIERVENIFKEFKFETNPYCCDLYFYGIKK